MTFMQSFSSGKDTELSRLKSENQSLSEELLQCRADKEFVWSLWKRLQVANPDITQAVGLVAQREKEKSELKDRKVLEILNVKDDKIDELQKLVANQSKELSELIIKKTEFEDRVTSLEKENVTLRMRVEEADSNVHSQASREAVRELDKENLDLKQELARYSAQIEKLEKEKDDLMAVRDSHRERIKLLEEDKDLDERYESLSKQTDEYKKKLRKYEHQISSMQKELKTKNKELEEVRAEMAEIWSTHRQTTDHATQQADVIRQLQNLQTDTQKMLQNTENAYKMDKMTMHSEHQALRSSELEMRRQMEVQAQTIDEQEKLLQELQKHLESKEATLKEVNGTGRVNSQLTHLQEEIEDLKYKLDNRSRSVSPSPIRSRSKVKKGRSKVRSRSLSVNTEHKENDARLLSRKLENTERKLSDAQLMLHHKTKELSELRRAHERRLERLKGMQVEHKLLKQQCAMFEEELYGPKRPSKKKIRRSPPKSLQKEDSDSVWNELAFYRKEAKNYKTENMNLQEECDSLKVRLTQSEATIHELKSCLEHEREELQFVLDQQKEQTPEQLQELDELQRQLQVVKAQLDSCRRKLQEQDSEQRIRREEHSEAQEERRALKAEINLLRQQDASYRIKIADFKNEVARLQRELKKNKKRKSQTKEKSRKYQQTLNKSIHAMSEVFDDFNKDGWEDVTPSEERTGTEDATMTSAGTGASLGEDIVAHAQNSMHDRSFDEPRLSSTPSRGRPLSRVDDDLEFRRLTRATQAMTRSVALSPIRIPPDSQHPKTRSVASSPVRMSPPTPPPATSKPAPVVSKKSGISPATNSTRQVAALKQRVAALISQVSVIKSAKDACMRSSVALKVSVEQLETELAAANTKSSSLRNTVTRLTTEVDRLKADKEILEQRIHDQSIESSNQPLHSDHEFATMQSRLKSATGEVSRQLTQIKAFKSDNITLEEKVSQLQEKNKSLERDNAQKRILAEDMKMKLKAIQDSVKSDADIMDDVEHKMRTVAELNQRYKTQLNSLKTRLAAVTKEKCDNEDKVIKLSNELDRKSKLISELQSRARSLQATVATVERTAQQQLTSLADHSEVAIDTAQAKLMQMDGQLNEFSKFVKVFAHALSSSTQQARELCTQQRLKRQLATRNAHAQEEQEALRKVKHVACGILDIDETQLHDIMHAHELDAAKIQEMKSAEDQKKDKKWCKKWEKLIQLNGEFAVSLTEVMMEKVDERCRVASEIAVT